MIQNILHNKVRSIDARLINDQYYDYMLYKGGVLGSSDIDECLAAHINASDENTYREDGGFQSVTEWEGAINDGVEILSGKTGFGITAVDNGRFHYIKDLITNEEFLKIFFSGLTIDSEEKQLVLYPVVGNTLQYNYWQTIETEEERKYFALKGGFLQGFFKLDGLNYQVLPSYIDCDLMVEVKLRPRTDYETCFTTLNDVYPENSGIFFYVGTRAENKYAELYNGTYKPTFESGNTGQLTFYSEKDLQDEKYAPFASLISDKQDVPISGITIDAKKDEYSYETDNKHLFFDRTERGFTTETWDREAGEFVKMYGVKQKEYDKNAFLLFNRTESGLTADKADAYLKSLKDDYDMEKDIIGNAFALKLNDDYSISYRYTIKNCDAESGYETIEESTKPGLVKKDEWNLISVRFVIVSKCGYDKCYKPINLGKRKMRIMIYVNGYLAFLSKELPELVLRPLNDLSERQYGVPYNISLGGGTQGLGERIWLDYYQPIKNHYYLEKNYAGSFIGDIEKLKIYTCKKQYSDIKNNYLIEIGEKEEKMDKKFIYAGMALEPETIINAKYKRSPFKEALNKVETVCATNGSKFYVLIPKRSTSLMPTDFTMHGTPVVMTESEFKHDGETYTLFTSGEIYPIGAKLTIIAVTI